MLQVDENKLVETKWGFYEFENIPSDAELSDFYAKKYYQEERGGYKYNYDKQEAAHIEFVNNIIYRKARQLFADAKTMADVGCGQGYLSKEFSNKGFDVKSFDFSSEGFINSNPELSDCFVQGNIFETVKSEFSQKKYDVIAAISILEHIGNAEKFVELLKAGMGKDSIMILTVPNDCSYLNEKLINEGLVKNKAWISYPEHLRYFNKDTLASFLNGMGLDVLSMVADYPIGLFLLNNDLNYYNDRSKGPIAHKQRLVTDLFLSELDRDKVIKLYEAYADLGIGRGLTCFCKLKG